MIKSRTQSERSTVVADVVLVVVVADGDHPATATTPATFTTTTLCGYRGITKNPPAAVGVGSMLRGRLNRDVVDVRGHRDRRKHRRNATIGGGWRIGR